MSTKPRIDPGDERPERDRYPSARAARAKAKPRASIIRRRRAARVRRSGIPPPVMPPAVTPAMTPGERYRDEIARGVLMPDPAQAALVGELDRIHRSLVAAPDGGMFARIARRLGRGRREPVRGLYVWGGVGRGKTHLVDLFHRAPRLDPKLRMHFHRFMRLVHGELNALPEREDPLRIVAGRIAARARVLCLDEFHVSDITDAMILGRLLGALFERGTTLLATSNIVPSSLYAGGLQRERFLPAIALIERHTKVVHLDSGADYRLRTLERARTWYSPLGPDAERGLAECFRALAPEHVADGDPLTILGRTVPAVRHADGIAWFDFETLCGGPRSVADYIEIARDFHTVVLSGVPVLDDDRRDPVRRFIHLVDEFYDRNVNLLVSAETSPEGLYAGRKLVEPFQRTRSRLVEMQSTAYLGRGHLP